uniref:TPR_REGION domain-containing protein n=1 Tax=Mesocestoides corti TaxID=53468 RepID=A0A5K3FRZ1_MESCO
MSSEMKRKLYHSIVAYLKMECSCGEYSSDTIESLEVARQCIESAFGVSGDQVPETDLLSFFENISMVSKVGPPETTAEDKAMAENLKTQGNSCMAAEKFKEAIACYSRAIELDPMNAIYYCNRAAAHSRLNKNEECVADCKLAIKIDPKYSKAYGRMGLAYSNMGNFTKAIESYKKAVSLDPSNLNLKQNLAIAESRLQETSTQSATTGANLFGSPGGNIDLNTLLSNPMLQDMAQRLMSDPQMQNTVSSMMQGIFRDGSSPSETNASPPQASQVPSSLDDILRFGQQIAQQMRQSNPELVNTLRQQMQNLGGQESGRNNNGSNDKDATQSDP